MRRTIYLQMLYLIDMHKSWIALDGSRSYAPRIIFKRGRVLLCTFRTIRLRAIYKHNGYERGTKWSISEYELDRALAVYRKRNSEVKARLKKGASYLEAKDVNAIVEIATYGLLKLELSEFPLYKQR